MHETPRRPAPVPPKDPTAAVLLELLPGFLIQTFGVGHLYAGRVLRGLFIMFGYWILQGINLLLCLVLIGYLTLPATWLLFMILSPIVAARTAGASRTEMAWVASEWAS